MRFVGIKSPEQQSAMMLHRVRLILSRQRTQLSNALRAHLAEFGIVAPVGRNGIEQLLGIIADTDDDRLPADARGCLDMLVAQLLIVKQQILENDRRIIASARETELGRRLMEIPGVGPLLASAVVAAVPSPTVFRSGRDLSAWIGLVPRQNSSGGKERLGNISKAGHSYLRQMLIVGAMAVIRYAERNDTKRPWLVQLLARRKAKIAAVALANKTARTIWAMMTSGERYREPQVA
jgi:transposase